jgi:hypothetical protein
MSKSTTPKNRGRKSALEDLRHKNATAALALSTEATRLAIMLAVLGMTVWEAFGH